MILFQWIAFGVLGCLLVREAFRWYEGESRRSALVVRALLWIAAIVCIAWPNMTTYVAMHVGIQRGADLVQYVFCLAFLGTTLYFYSRQSRLEAQLTQIVRHIAIEHARHGPPNANMQNHSSQNQE